jgi:hypothetical protein
MLRCYGAVVADPNFGWRSVPERGFITSFWDGDRLIAALTDSVLEIEGTAIKLDTINGVAYHSVVRRTNGVRTSTTRKFVVSYVGGRKTLELDEGMLSIHGHKLHEQEWIGLVGISQKMLEPRLVDLLIKQLQAGKPYRLGTNKNWVALSGAGLEVRRMSIFSRGDKSRSYAWNQFVKADTNQGWVRIFARDTQTTKVKHIISLSMSNLNVVLLPALLSKCAKLLGAPAESGSVGTL